MKEYKLTCNSCNKERLVSASQYCVSKKKNFETKCKECNKIILISSGKNTRIQKGNIPYNKGINPNIKEDRRIYKLQWREENREKVNNYFKEYYHNNIEKGRLLRRLSRHNRRTIGEINKEIYDKLCLSTDKCNICLKYLEDNFEIDHITPIKLGGTNEFNNLQLLCVSCNRKKSSKSQEQFLNDLKLADGQVI